MSRKEADKQSPSTAPSRIVLPNISTNPPIQKRPWALALIAAIVIGGGLTLRELMSSSTAIAQSTVTNSANESGNSHRVSRTPQEPREVGPQHDVMAIVNGKDISRTALAQACVERQGEKVLESLVNKRLIQHHCSKRGIQVTEADIEVEVDRMAKRFKLGREQWFELLQNQRGITEQEYKREILWPTLALRKLAAGDLVATDEEIQKAYESKYGESIQARLIVVSDAKKAKELHREALARPSEFARLAMQSSEDVNSASIGGLIQPIFRHTGEALIERAAFNLKSGQISPVIHAGEQYAILKCESRNPPRNIALAAVRNELGESIKEEKLRGVANDLFAKLQSSATIRNIYNDPKLRSAMPGVVATVNGEQITMKELGNECLVRHGEETLQIEISHLLLKQELSRASLTVTQQDLQAEMEHAAKLAGMVEPNGKPNLAQWVEAATKEQEVSKEIYFRDSVWPSAALKKLTSGRVEVTEADLNKGFEANYGERVRCRAIVLGDLRRAQEVWAKARENDSFEHFGKLAEEYSIEPSSRSLSGEVPPIRRNGGQPQLEKAAFALAEGELSGIVQTGDKFLILKCEGYTKPLDIQLSEVQDLLMQDLLEKKTRIAMSEEFGQIRSRARIDNYLAGTSQSPVKNSKHANRKRDGLIEQTSGQR